MIVEVCLGKRKIVLGAESLETVVLAKAQSSPMSLRDDWRSSCPALGLCSCHSWSVDLTQTVSSDPSASRGQLLTHGLHGDSEGGQ